MKYISYFLVLIVMVIITWSTINSVNIVINRDIKLESYVPNSVIVSTSKLGDHLAISIVEAAAKDLNN